MIRKPSLLTTRDELTDKLRQLADDYTDDLLTRPEYARASQTIKGQLTDVERRISAHTRPTGVAHLLPVGETVRATWEKNDLAWRRQLLSLLVDRVVIKPSPGSGNMRDCDRFAGRWKFRAEDIEVTWIA